MPMTFRLSLFPGSMKLLAMNSYARSHLTRAAALLRGNATQRLACALKQGCQILVGEMSTRAGSARGAMRFPLALAVLSMGVIAGCSEPAAQNNNRSIPGAGSPVGVVTAPANTQPLGIDIEAVGTAVANESVEITSKTSNIVTSVRFQEGQLVKRGQILINLDDAQTQADVAVAEAALAESENQFKRSRNLFSTQALSQSELDQIEATHKANQARVLAARARLSDQVIRAPFDGRTGFRRVSVGSLVNPGTVITTLDDSSLIKLDFTVPQIYFFALRGGLEIEAQTSGLPNRIFKGKVSTLGSRIDTVSRSIMVRAEVPNKDGILRPGMLMTVKLHTEALPALLIPEQALVPEQGQMYVFVVEDGIAAKKPITIGRRRPGEVEVVTGLKNADRVIVEGTQKVRDRGKVYEISEAPAPAA
jgi:membrane fusion protein (multidrug efflux system)